MDELCEMLKLRDDRWGYIKASHKKCSMKLWKSVYDMLGHRIAVFDKKKEMPEKKSAKKIKPPQEEFKNPINEYARPEALEGHHYAQATPDSPISTETFKPVRQSTRI